MIKIQISNIDTIAGDFITRIENSVIKNNLSSSERKRLNGKSLRNGNELQKKIYRLYKCKPEHLKTECNQFENYLNTNGYSPTRKKNLILKYFDYDKVIGYVHKKKKHSYWPITLIPMAILQLEKNLILKYFDYDKVIGYVHKKKKHSYWLMDKLDVKVCPYCNRSYTFTINSDNKNIRPEFDHFYPKDGNKYPYLALSFYNLIPSCPICNHTKKTKEVDIHPYIESFGENCKFRIENIDDCILNDDYEKWNVYLEKSNTKFDRNISTFALKEFYNEHKDFISEIVFKARAYNDEAYKSIIDTFSSQGLTPKEMHLIIFGTYLDENELGLRPLSKLSKDIIEQIGIEE